MTEEEKARYESALAAIGHLREALDELKSFVIVANAVGKTIPDRIIDNAEHALSATSGFAK